MPTKNFIDTHAPLVFRPKVTPDPSVTQRLEKKLRSAAQQLTQAPQQESLRKSLSPRIEPMLKRLSTQ